MRRNALLVVLSVSVAASCSPVLAQSRGKGKKKEPPRVLKAGDEVKVWVDPNETLRDPNFEKSGVLSAGAIVFPTCRQPSPIPNTYECKFDDESRTLYYGAIRAGDKGGIDKLIGEGRAARVPVGAKLLVVSRDEVDCRGRVTEGEQSGRVIELPIKNLR